MINFNTYQYHGWIFQEFLPIHEDDVLDFSPLAGSYLIIVNNDRVLMCFNAWRNQWELPAGKREVNEHPRLCAARELYEETGQVANDLTFSGLLKLKNINTLESKYNSVYMQKLTVL